MVGTDHGRPQHKMAWSKGTGELTIEDLQDGCCGGQRGDDDEFRFNDASTHEGHLRQNGELTWFCNETIIMMSYLHKM